MRLRLVHTVLVATMLLLVGLFSVGPACAEVVCSGDDCSREVVAVGSAHIASPAGEDEAVARPATSLRLAELALSRAGRAALVPSPTPAMPSGRVPLRI